MIHMFISYLPTSAPFCTHHLSAHPSTPFLSALFSEEDVCPALGWRALLCALSTHNIQTFVKSWKCSQRDPVRLSDFIFLEVETKCTFIMILKRSITPSFSRNPLQYPPLSHKQSLGQGCILDKIHFTIGF